MEEQPSNSASILDKKNKKGTQTLREIAGDYADFVEKINDMSVETLHALFNPANKAGFTEAMTREEKIQEEAKTRTFQERTTFNSLNYGLAIAGIDTPVLMEELKEHIATALTLISNVELENEENAKIIAKMKIIDPTFAPEPTLNPTASPVATAAPTLTSPGTSKTSGPILSTQGVPFSKKAYDELIKSGGSFTQDDDGTFHYIHTNKVTVSGKENGVWRGTSVPPANNLDIQAEHLYNTALALIAVVNASIKNSNDKDRSIDLNMENVSEEQKPILESRLRQKLQSDPQLKNIDFPIKLNGKTIKYDPSATLEMSANASPQKNTPKKENPPAKPLPTKSSGNSYRR